MENSIEDDPLFLQEATQSMTTQEGIISISGSSIDSGALSDNPDKEQQTIREITVALTVVSFSVLIAYVIRNFWNKRCRRDFEKDYQKAEQLLEQCICDHDVKKAIDNGEPESEVKKIIKMKQKMTTNEQEVFSQVQDTLQQRFTEYNNKSMPNTMRDDGFSKMGVDGLAMSMPLRGSTFKKMRKSKRVKKNQDTAGFDDSDPFTSSKRGEEDNEKKRRTTKKSSKSKKKLDTVKSASQQILDLDKLDRSSNNDEFLRKEEDRDNIHVTHSVSDNTDLRDKGEIEFNINQSSENESTIQRRQPSISEPVKLMTNQEENQNQDNDQGDD